MEEQQKSKVFVLALLGTIVLIMVLISVIWSSIQDSSSSNYEVKREETKVTNTAPVYKDAPDVILKDKFDRIVTLKGAQPTGRYYYFWATWCTVCQQQNPQVFAAYQKYGANIDFYSINLTDTEDANLLKKYVEDKPFPFSMLFDATGQVAKAYGVKATPTQVFISKSGKIIDLTYGLEADELDERLAGLLSQP